uniref:Uncharacterized protein n=1 Tax=Salmo trutta TaxID=8032 RepID=A0A674E7F1_SALTR
MMSSSITTTTNGEVVITHVHPSGNGVRDTSLTHCQGQTVSSALGRFRIGHPKALGIIPVLDHFYLFSTFWFVALAKAPLIDSIGGISLIFVWGFIIVISLSADNKLNKCLVKGPLGMNVVATVTALTGIILHSLDGAGIMLNYNWDYPYCYVCQQYWRRSQGISGVLAVSSALEFKVSSVSRRLPEVLFIGNEIPLGSIVIPSNAPFPPQNNYEGPEGAGIGTGVQQNHLPPQYTAVIP